MRHGVGEEYSQGFSVQLTRARGQAREQLNDTELVRALRTVRNEVLPLADKLRQSAPETFEAHRDALAVLLNDCALALVDEEPRPSVASFDPLPVRRIDLRDVDALLDAGRPGERPVIQQLFRGAVGYAKDPVLREVIKANQQGVHILQRANRRIQMLVDAI
ncbi:MULTISPECIES: hypothetical protein [Streptomyces]|uniref:Uncharacterized protein n=1 Tax=Streptomyces liliifuscus TaxID=2797636 RepID=A0A7T7KVR5_9ACTN|nr:hypothetical protein [Streptomyces liliifuscus]QQM40475.1 hypothetical protein JEQ17_13970 [Streptomyces liliifuscus]